MKLTKRKLEHKVDEYNDWLEKHTIEHPMYRITEHRKNYYIKKLAEMDELELKTIEI